MGFRTHWYREQLDAWEAMMAAKSAARRRRPRVRLTQTWNRLETTSVRLANLLEDALRTMHSPAPGEPVPEISVTLVADLSDDLPQALEAPHRAKPVNPLGRRRVGAGGNVETHAVLARVEITAKLTIYGTADAPPPAEMMRRTWFLPTKTAENI